MALRLCSQVKLKSRSYYNVDTGSVPLLLHLLLGFIFCHARNETPEGDLKLSLQAVFGVGVTGKWAGRCSSPQAEDRSFREGNPESNYSRMPGMPEVPWPPDLPKQSKSHHRTLAQVCAALERVWSLEDLGQISLLFVGPKVPQTPTARG